MCETIGEVFECFCKCLSLLDFIGKIRYLFNQNTLKNSYIQYGYTS